MSLLSSIPIIPPPGISPSWPPGDVGYPPNLIPHPAGFDAPPYAELAFFFIAGAAVVLLALPWALRSAWGLSLTPCSGHLA